MNTPRNKLSRLPVHHRQTLLHLLVDGATYQACRDRLLADGVPAGDVPTGDASFAAYKRGEEFRRYRDEFLLGAARAAREKQLWEALAAGGGLDPVAQHALFEGIVRAREVLTDSEARPREILNAVNALTNVNAVVVQRAKLKLAEAKQAHELTPEEQVTAEDLEAAANKLDELLGVKR